jgi:hypothetical protein
MRISDFYRGLLRLYPTDFQEQFSEEMLGVFEQRATEHFASGGTASIALVAKEFLGIAKGGCMMRMANILPVRRSSRNNSQPSAVTPVHTPLTIAEATKQRDAAVRNMVTAIAGHDFPKARLYSYEEIRLKNLLRNLQSTLALRAPENLAGNE